MMAKRPCCLSKPLLTALVYSALPGPLVLHGKDHTLQNKCLVGFLRVCLPSKAKGQYIGRVSEGIAGKEDDLIILTVLLQG